MEEESDPDEYLNKFVTDRLKAENPWPLDDVKNDFRHTKGFLQLSSRDNNYIENEYLNVCSELLLDDIKIYVKSRLKRQDRTNFMKYLFTFANSLSKFSEIKPPLSQLIYYQRIKNIIDLLTEDEEENLMQRIKRNCMENVLSYSNSVEKELVFLKNIIEYFELSEVGVEKLPLKEFCSSDLLFREFLRQVMKIDETLNDNEKWKVLDQNAYNVKLKSVKDNAANLLSLKDYFFVDTAKQILTPYSKSVTMTKEFKDGRYVLEVYNKFITLSKVLSEIELQLASVDEVRFVGADILYIDANLYKNKWHGKNVVVYAKRILVHGTVIWDLSGQDKSGVYTQKAGTGPDGNGINGSDGQAGESGGNVTFISDSVVTNPKSLTIISDGGNGGAGQAGGDGRNGSNGQGIYRNTVESLFQSPLRGSGYYTVSNIKNRTSYYDHDSYNGYINGHTHEGNNITLSVYYGFMNEQAYFLYQGSPGGAGGSGGQGGYGGEGGFPGEIDVGNVNINITCQQGEKGQNGKGGHYGRPGRNGWDIGYTDYGWWINKDYYGLDYNSKFEINYFSSKGKTRFWSPHHGMYAELARVNNYYNGEFNGRNNYIARRNLHVQTKATRKKTISKAAIKTQYSHLFTSSKSQQVTDMMQQLRARQDEALTTAIKLKKAVKIQTRVKIQRQLQVPFKEKKKKHRATTQVKFNVQSKSFIDFLKSINNVSATEDEWKALKTIEMSWEELSQVLQIFEKYRENGLKEIEDILIEKSKFAILKKIVPSVEADALKNSKVNKTVNAENAGNFLVNTKENLNHKIIQILNNGDSFEELKVNNDQSSKFKRSVAQFVLESNDPVTTKWKEDYDKFLEKQQKSVKLYLEIFLNALRHIKDIKTPKNLQSIISGDKFLEILYRKYQSKIRIDYDWNDCCKDESILKAYEKFLKKTGSSSASYRELLAGNHNINLRLYEQDYSGKFTLIDNHNPFSNEILYVLWDDNLFTLLEIDSDFLILTKYRATMCNDFYKLSLSVDKLKTRKQFEDFLRAPLIHEETNISPAVLNENQYIEDIVTYFSADEQKILRQRLKYIGGVYIENSEILKVLSKRFQIEQRHVSFETILLLINCIIITYEQRDNLDLYLLIMKGSMQKNWINELLLISFENKYRSVIDKKRFNGYLSKISNQNILLLLYSKLADQFLPLDQLEEILSLLSNIPEEDFSEIQDMGLPEWPYALKAKYFTHKLKQLTSWKDQKTILGAVANLLLSLENSEGKGIVENLINKCFNDRVNLSSEDAKRTLYDLVLRFYKENPKITNDIINQFKGGNIREWILKLEEQYPDNSNERKIEELVVFIEGNGNTSKNILQNLSRVKQTILNLEKLKCKEIDKLIKDFTEIDIKTWLQKKNFNEEKIEEMLAVIVRGIELRKGFRLRHTSQLTILSLNYNPRNTLLQMSTGEGKSMVIVALAIIKALSGERADIITNSSVLARRDAVQNKDVFDLFNVHVYHNCDDEMEFRKQAYSNNQVVYGDLASFQRDYLLDKFYGQNILGDRDMQNIFVDEVDSMLLDNGNNILYLSQDLIGLDKLEALYVYIWRVVNKPIHNFDDLKSHLDVSEIKKYIIFELYGYIEKEDLRLLNAKINNLEVNQIWGGLIKEQLIYADGRFNEANISNLDSLEKALSPNLLLYKDRLKFLLDERVNRERSVRIPRYLNDFVLGHLDKWINSAINALFLREQVDYVVDVTRSNKSIQRRMEIIILDRDTGTDKRNSQWDESLHQFLQLKHGCRISLQSLKSIFISNISYFKKYSKLYGLTGTLGSHRERDLLKEIHDVDFVTIPTFKLKKFIEEDPVLCKDSKDWVEKVFSETRNKTLLGRSVLIICDSVSDVTKIYKKFDEENVKNVHTYTRDYEKFDVIQGDAKLEQGHVIIATNLAGRGIDIKITKELERAGGLHVIVSNLPQNVRIEQQAFGRAARKGERGSGQLIFLSPDGQSVSKMFQMKHERDLKELERISQIKLRYDSEIVIEEDCFMQFQKQFEILSMRIKSEDGDLREILLQSCLDNWSFWLDSISGLLKKPNTNTKSKEINGLLQDFLRDLNHLSSHNFLEWVKNSPFLSLRLGNYFLRKKDFTKAREHYNYVIDKEPTFCEAAHLYNGFTLFEENLETCKSELNKAKNVIEGHIEALMTSSSIIRMLKKNNSSSFLQIEEFEDQKKGEIEIYNIIKSSINDILGHPINTGSFATTTVDHITSYEVYNALINSSICEKPKVTSLIPSDVILRICDDIGIVSYEKLLAFLLKYSGKGFIEEDLQLDLKRSVEMPSRENFWGLLLKKNLIKDQSSYVLLNVEQLVKIMPKLELPKNEKLFEDKSNKLFLKTEILGEEYMKYTYEENYFRSHISKKDFEVLEKFGVITYNKMASLNVKDFNLVDFEHFDSITFKDFQNVGIPELDVNSLIGNLLNLNILERRNTASYKLIANFKDVANLKMPDFGVYESRVKILLFRHFAYRIAWQKIELQVAAKHPTIRIELISNLDVDVVSRLFENSIIKPAKIHQSSDVSEANIGKIIKKLDSKKKREISETLKELRSSLANYEQPTIKLKSLANHLNERNLPNIQIFLLNGFDNVLDLEEAKYTLSMILQTLVVVLIAVVQIAVGAALQLLTAGAVSFIGTALISEGISDIIFAASCFRSGYFSWADYGEHKWQSILVSVVSCGIGSFFARGAQFAKIMANSTWKVVGREMAKQVALKTVHGLAHATVYVGIDVLIERCMKKICKDLAASAVVNIEQAVDQSKEFNDSVQKAFLVLGPDNAKVLIGGLMENYFSQERFVEKYLPLLNNLTNSIIFQIREAKRHVNKRLKIYAMIGAILADVVFSVGQLVAINNFAKNICQDLAKEIDEVLQNKNQKKTSDEKNGSDTVVEVKAQLKKMLREKCGQIVHQHVLNPLFQAGSTELLNVAGKAIKRTYTFWKQGKVVKHFEEQKQSYLEELAKIHNDTVEEPVDLIKSKLNKDYHENVLGLEEKAKTKEFKEKLLKEFLQVNKALPESALENRINTILEEKKTNLKIKKNKYKEKSPKDIQDLIESVKNRSLRDHLLKVFAGKESKFEGSRKELSAADRKKFATVLSYLSPIATKNRQNYRDELDQETSRLEEFKLVYEKVREINRVGDSLAYKSDTSLIPEYVLTLKFIKDNINISDDYLQSKRLNTIAAGLKDGILYLACNYQTVFETGKVHDDGSKIYSFKNSSWGDDPSWMSHKMKKYCELNNIKKIVLLDPATKPTSIEDNRRAHAEMQLLAYAKKNGFKFDQLDTSKPPCANCMRILHREGVEYFERPGINVSPKRWQDPDEMTIIKAASFDLKRDYTRIPDFRIPQVKFKEAVILTEWHTINEDNSDSSLEGKSIFGKNIHFEKQRSDCGSTLEDIFLYDIGNKVKKRRNSI